MRIHLFEFEDLPWFPDVIRTGGTDYLRYFLIRSELYKPAIALMNQTLNGLKESHIVDLCSGGGGYIEQVYNEINRISTHPVAVTLTDKFPNVQAYQLLQQRTQGGIRFVSSAVDATDVPDELKGFRTMFSAVHHFRPEQVRAVLKDAVESRAAIGFFDGGEKGILAILGLIIIHPIAFFLFTPFFKPFRWSRLFFTYIVPLIPLYTIWDGVVSILRMYQPEELLQLARSVDDENYNWKSGKTRNRFGVRATYLIGYPKEQK